MRSADRLLWRTVRATGRWNACLLGVGLLDAGARVAVPATVGGALDSAIAAGTVTATTLLPLAVLVLAGLTEPARSYLTERANVQGARWLRGRLAAHLIRLGPRGPAPGESLARVLESGAEAATVGAAGLSLVTSLTTSLAGLVALLLIDFWIGVVFLLGAPVVWLLTRWLVGRVGTMTGRYQRAHADLAGRFLDAVTGVRTIRASGTVQAEIDRVLVPLGELRATGTDYWETQRRSGWQLGVLVPALQIGALCVAGTGLAAGRLSPGEMVAVSGYLAYALGLLRQAAVFAKFARARGSATRIAEVLDIEPPRTGGLSLPRGQGTVRLSGVRLSIEDRAVLDGVDLELPAGACVALVGPSGAGKSALAEIVAGLCHPDEGSVLLDGVELAEIEPTQRGMAIGYAAQRPRLLGSTVRAALRFTDSAPPDWRVTHGLRLADAEFVHRLPAGLDTPVPELRCSGGEWQRLGLARLAAREVRLVVLDDATSNVDVVTEASIGAALAESMPGTKLVVTHRAAVAAAADLVAWLQDGRIRAVGRHADLLDLPDYAALFGMPGSMPEAA